MKIYASLHPVHTLPHAQWKPSPQAAYQAPACCWRMLTDLQWGQWHLKTPWRSSVLHLSPLRDIRTYLRLQRDASHP